MARNDPDWVGWAREIQALAQSGLTFTRDQYDRERYERLRTLAAEMFSSQIAMPAADLSRIFEVQSGYATPKIDVRGAVFDAEGRILMVREVADQDRWTLPGGWADVTHTVAENVIKEVKEESGYEVEATKLAAALDRSQQGHPLGVFSCTKMFFVCRILGGAPAVGIETSEVRWFSEDEIPADLSESRVLPHQVARMFDHYRQPLLATDFE